MNIVGGVDRPTYKVLENPNWRLLLNTEAIKSVLTNALMCMVVIG